MKLAILAFSALLCAGQAWGEKGKCIQWYDCHTDASGFGGCKGRLVPCKPHVSNRQFVYSQAFLASSAAADIASSRGLYELNPALGRGPFSARQEAIKISGIAALIGAEFLFVRRWPSMRRGFTIANYVMGGATFGAAAHNWSIK